MATYIRTYQPFSFTNRIPGWYNNGDFNNKLIPNDNGLIVPNYTRIDSVTFEAFLDTNLIRGWQARCDFSYSGNARDDINDHPTWGFGEVNVSGDGRSYRQTNSITLDIPRKWAAEGNGKNIVPPVYTFLNSARTTYTVNNAKLTINYTLPSLDFQLTSNGHGASIGSGKRQIKEHGTVYTFIFNANKPDPGYEFKEWQDSSGNILLDKYGNPEKAYMRRDFSDKDISQLETTIIYKAIFVKKVEKINQIYIGPNLVKEIYIGDKPVKAIYVGDKLIYGLRE